MTKFMDLLKKYEIRFILAIIVYFFIAKNLILNGKIISYDDTLILEPLYEIKSLSGYIKALTENKIWDIQPIRDLSYFIDFKLYSLFSWWTYHLTSYLLWTLSFIFFYKCSQKLLSIYYENTNTLGRWAFFIAVIFYFHPVFQLEPFWISSRKHLLSTLFIFLSFYYFLKFEQNEGGTKKNIFLITLFYFLSVFSQPITMLYPFFLMGYKVVNSKISWIYEKKNQALLFSTLIVFIVAFGANYYFYYIVYPKLTHGAVVGFKSSNMLQIRLLTIGRFFYQIFDFTMASPVEHDRGSIRNVIGLLSFPIFGYICYKFINRQLFIILLGWFFFPLTIVILGDVKLFALDTYLVTASFGILLLTISLFIKFKFHKLYFILILPLLYFTHDYSKKFHKPYDLAVYAQEKEITNFGQYILTNELLTMGKFNEAFEEAYAFSKIYPESKDLNFLLPAALMGTSKITPPRKKEILKDWRKNSFLAEFYYSMFLNQNTKEFREIQDKAIERITETFYLKELNNFALHTLAYYVYHCKKENLNYCDATFNRLKDKMPPGFWNEQIYKQYLANFELEKQLLSPAKPTDGSNDKLNEILFTN